jgi:hypothetical protein
MNLKKQKKVRDRLLQLLRDLEALLVVGNLMTRTARSELEARKLGLKGRSNITKIGTEIRLAERQIAKVRDWLGVKVPNQKVVELLQFVEDAPEGKMALIPKHILQEVFSFPERSFERFRDFPAHARIALYLTKPSHHDPVSTVDWRSTEATLFEDMCALYNLAREASEKLKTAIDSLLAKKSSMLYSVPPQAQLSTLLKPI